MACRITNLKPPCGYNTEGIYSILLLDFEDFGGFAFDGDDLYNSALVTAIYRGGDWVELDSPALVARYTSTRNNGVYAHQLETFVSDLSADLLAQLHLATKRRQLVVFKTYSGRHFTFGYEEGAALTYQSQTADNIGAIVTLTAASVYPLFEVTADAVTGGFWRATWRPDFETYYVCNSGGTGLAQTLVMYKIDAFFGLPLDVDSVPIIVSGRRQAIAILQGASNPDAAAYEIERVFDAGDTVDGVPSTMLHPDCAAGFLTVTPDPITLNAAQPTVQVTVISSAPWQISSVPTFLSFDVTNGATGVTVITASATASEGQGFIVFSNTDGATQTIYAYNLETLPWVLETGFWDMEGFWYDDGVWNF